MMNQGPQLFTESVFNELLKVLVVFYQLDIITEVGFENLLRNLSFASVKFHWKVSLKCAKMNYTLQN